MMPASIFIVDRSPAVRRMIEQIASPQGYEVLGFQDGPAALEAARRMTPVLIIADYHLADMTFSGFCKEVDKLEHLTETMLVSIVASSDRLDEEHLRSLGVRAFLKKPLQSEELMETINRLANGARQDSAAARPLKKRAWPPDSTATDLDHLAETSADIEETASSEPDTSLKEQPPMTPMTSPKTSVEQEARTTSQPPSSGTAAGEDALRALLDYLLQSLIRDAEEKIAALVPLIVSQELTLHVAKAVREELQSQFISALSEDRIKTAVRGIIMAELPKQTASHLAALETTVRQHVGEIMPALVEQTGENLMHRFIEPGLEKYIPPAVRVHLGPVEPIIKKEVREAVAASAKQSTEEIVREMAREHIHEAVRLSVPDIAEAQVKEEIRRLTAVD
jgi:CheY-like chemotaxis protein